MIDSTKPIDDATPLDDVSGLKLSKSKRYSFGIKAYLVSTKLFRNI